MRTATLLLSLATTLSALADPGGTRLIVEDAERFAAILAAGPAPTAEILQERYLDPGTPAIRLFTPNRIVDAKNLAHVVAGRPEPYRRALEHCLPAARALQAEAGAIIGRVAALLGRSDGASVHAVFGALTSGGTAGRDGVVLGLDVLCQGISSREAAETVLREFIAHEMAHVYQLRAGARASDDLLHQSMIEGFADFVMERVVKGEVRTGADRTAYGLANEAALWREFIADADAGRRDTDWLYRYKVARAGQPPDMGYWLGKRICEAYFARAGDKAAAMKALLEMRDARAILAASGYPGAR